MMEDLLQTYLTVQSLQCKTNLNLNYPCTWHIDSTIRSKFAASCIFFLIFLILSAKNNTKAQIHFVFEMQPDCHSFFLPAFFLYVQFGYVCASPHLKAQECSAHIFVHARMPKLVSRFFSYSVFATEKEVSLIFLAREDLFFNVAIRSCD